jgi:ribosomal protection tetracycline resistance protein
VFKVERGAAGEKIAYARLFSGIICVRDRVPTGEDAEGRVTAISVFDRGSAVRSASVGAGQIAKLWGLGSVRIGDPIGRARAPERGHAFNPPTLETIIVPRRADERGALHGALSQLAEQDPLINLRRDDLRRELFVSLYGEVQKEVIEATLANDFGLEVEFLETTMICVERPLGVGAALEIIGKEPNPFLATVGLRVEPAPLNAGVIFRLQPELGSIPLFVYKSADAFREAMGDTVRQTLRQGLYGWEVTDCLVTLTQTGYWSPSSTAGDFRKLTPLVLMSALQQAGTVVCEPLQRFQLEIPADTLSGVLSALARLRAVPLASSVRGPACLVEGEIPAAQVHALQQLLPSQTRGEGVLESAFDRYEPLRGAPPSRPRTDHNPLNRREYLLHVVRRV